MGCVGFGWWGSIGRDVLGGSDGLVHSRMNRGGGEDCRSISR